MAISLRVGVLACEGIDVTIATGRRVERWNGSCDSKEHLIHENTPRFDRRDIGWASGSPA
jgi:hypothetical protein